MEQGKTSDGRQVDVVKVSKDGSVGYAVTVHGHNNRMSAAVVVPADNAENRILPTARIDMLTAGKLDPSTAGTAIEGCIVSGKNVTIPQQLAEQIRDVARPAYLSGVDSKRADDLAALTLQASCAPAAPAKGR